MTEKGFRLETEFGPLNISADEQQGFRPYQLMVASIVGCSGTVMKKILKKKRKEVEDIRITAEVKRNPDQADRIEKMHITFYVKAPGLTEAALEKIVHLTRKYCSMVQSVQDAIEITESFEMIE
nr:OsmC family protein [Pullulanibacillus pueri]